VYIDGIEITIRKDIMNPMAIYLRPTSTIDCDSVVIREKASELVKDHQEVVDMAKALFYFVRDEIKYNLFVPNDKPEYYRASEVLKSAEGFCAQKAVLLAALARSLRIPSRLHLAAIRNHLVPIKVKELLGGDLFPTHCYNELYIERRWIKAAPTFDLRMCQKNRFLPVDFDGKHDAILPARDQEGRPHIEYVQDHGCFDDLPFEKIIAWRTEILGADGFERIRRAIELRKKRA
jgi:transglutaminase-like putative cysteine protease